MISDQKLAKCEVLVAVCSFYVGLILHIVTKTQRYPKQARYGLFEDKKKFRVRIWAAFGSHFRLFPNYNCLQIIFHFAFLVDKSIFEVVYFMYIFQGDHIEIEKKKKMIFQFTVNLIFKQLLNGFRTSSQENSRKF